MEARPFRGGGMDFQAGGAQDSMASSRGTQRKQMKTFNNMVKKAKQVIDDHGVKS